VDLTIIVGTFGDQKWSDLAKGRAVPSAESEDVRVIHNHGEVLESYGASLAACRNDAARKATTEFLLFLDADDEIEPGFVKAMGETNGDLRTPAVRYIRPGRGAARPMFWPEKNIQDSNYLIVSTLIRRELFWEVGGFEPFDLYEDWCLFSRCIKAGATVTRVPDAICRVHIDPQSKHRYGSSRAEKLAAHHAVRSAVWPELNLEEAA